MGKRDRAEAVAILGRDLVAEALADPARTSALFTEHAEAVAEAAQGVLDRRQDVEAARGFAATLPYPVRLALAAAWAGDVGTRALEGLGLHG
ncbi:MAG: hypothetical protein FJ029_13055 [Actinobacteria bacterium]|nr:hypothetical protein [Actinomycetota bacterium]